MYQVAPPENDRTRGHGHADRRPRHSARRRRSAPQRRQLPVRQGHPVAPEPAPRVRDEPRAVVAVRARPAREAAAPPAQVLVQQARGRLDAVQPHGATALVEMLSTMTRADLFAAHERASFFLVFFIRNSAFSLLWLLLLPSFRCVLAFGRSSMMVVAVSIRKSGMLSPRRWPQEREAFLARMQFAGSVEGLKYTAREALLQRCEQPACFRYLKHVLKALPPRVRPRVCVFLFPFGTTGGYVSIRIRVAVPRIP